MAPVTPPPAPSAARFFTPAQRLQVQTIVQVLWPGTDDSPGAADADAVTYIDRLLGSDPALYYEIADWRSLYTAGLAMLSAASVGALSKPLETLNIAETTKLLGDLSQGRLAGFPDGAWQRQFFGVLRAHCIEGCLADPRWGGNRDQVIWRWLGYPGGQARPFRRA